jgi:hypothetical protein
VKANRLVLLAVAGVSTLALSGCAQSGNVAARVGDTTVTMSDVDLLTDQQCDDLDRAAKDPAQAGQTQAVPKATLRAFILNALVDAEVNRQAAASEHLTYDKAALSSAMQRYESSIVKAPAGDRDRYRDLLERVLRGRLQAYDRVRDQLGSQSDNTAVDQAITDFETDMRKTVDVKVNPQLGADADGVAGAVDPSLSRAVSSFAKQSTSAQPDAAWVGKLPDAQRCG